MVVECSPTDAEVWVRFDLALTKSRLHTEAPLSPCLSFNSTFLGPGRALVLRAVSKNKGNQ